MNVIVRMAIGHKEEYYGTMTIPVTDSINQQKQNIKDFGLQRIFELIIDYVILQYEDLRF